MRRTVLVLALGLALLAFAATGCGGEEETSPTPETVEGTLTTETTDTTETETTDETDTGTTDETETETGSTGGGDPVAGKEVFIANCGGCHTLADAGTSGTIGPNLDDAQPSSELVVDRVTNGQGAMPPFEGTLTAQQIADVSAYVSETAGS